MSSISSSQTNSGSAAAGQSNSKNEVSSDAVVGQTHRDHPANSSITPNFANNRNPRNLERLRIAEKADGWDLEMPGKSFWNK
jgi:hypothetical protein